MTRWKKDTTEFDMKLSYSRNKDGSKTMACRVPRQIFEFLGEPSLLRFCINDGKVSVEGVNAKQT